MEGETTLNGCGGETQVCVCVYVKGRKPTWKDKEEEETCVGGMKEKQRMWRTMITGTGRLRRRRRKRKKVSKLTANNKVKNDDDKL